MKAKIEILYVLLCSVLLAVFFVPALFLGDLISYKFHILPFIYGGLMAALYALMMKSDKSVRSLAKWGLSLPISYLLLQYFWKTDYAVRSLNWAIKGYGRQSAGGAFAGGFYMAAFCAFCVIAVFCICPLKITNHKLFKKIQICAGSVTGLVIVAVTLLLERAFPSYSDIFSG